RDDLHRLADQEGRRVVHEAADDGLSGTRSRDKALACVDMLRRGDIDVLAVWKWDRFSREGAKAVGHLQDALDERARTGRPALFVAMQDGLRSDSSAWDVQAAVVAAVGRMETNNIRVRVASHIKSQRAKGKWTGGAGIPYGYRSTPAPDGEGKILVPDPVEVAIVQRMARDVLAGVPLSHVAKRLNDAGVATARSPYRRALLAGRDTDGLDRGTWTPSVLRALLTRDALAGRIIHDGQVILDTDGTPLQAFEPVIDAGTLAMLRDKLNRGPGKTPGPARRKHARLLSGVAVCALCAVPMYVTNSSGKAAYRCRSNWERSGSCRSTTINAAGLEGHVQELFLTDCGDVPETRVEETEQWVGELATVQAGIDRALDEMRQEGADIAALAARMEALKGRAAEYRARPQRLRRIVHTGRTGGAADGAAETVHEQRNILCEYEQRVEVAPATRRGISPIDDSRVTVIYHDQEE